MNFPEKHRENSYWTAQIIPDRMPARASQWYLQLPHSGWPGIPLHAQNWI